MYVGINVTKVPQNNAPPVRCGNKTTRRRRVVPEKTSLQHIVKTNRSLKHNIYVKAKQRAGGALSQQNTYVKTQKQRAGVVDINKGPKNNAPEL